ncbi:MAG: hypothetical protein PVG84_07515, partial [Desulfobacterales bacterium]
PFAELPVFALVLVSSFFFLLNIRNSYPILLIMMQKRLRIKPVWVTGIMEYWNIGFDGMFSIFFWK